MILQECLDTLRHDRMGAQHIQNKYEKASGFTAVLYIVLNIDLLIKVFADDQGQHRFHAAYSDQMLGHTVTAVFSGTGKCRRQDRNIVGK